MNITLDVASNNPDNGFVKRPVSPLAEPSRRPENPDFSDSFIGYVKTPDIPSSNPIKNELAPYENPSIKFLGR